MEEEQNKLEESPKDMKTWIFDGDIEEDESVNGDKWMQCASAIYEGDCRVKSEGGLYIFAIYKLQNFIGPSNKTKKNWVGGLCKVCSTWEEPPWESSFFMELQVCSRVAQLADDLDRVGVAQAANEPEEGRVY